MLSLVIVIAGLLLTFICMAGGAGQGTYTSISSQHQRHRKRKT